LKLKTKVLNASLLPPFTIEDETDGGDEQRMKYRYLDLRRNCHEKEPGTEAPDGK
jgi:aspartyl-tRNA synthetase